VADNDEIRALWSRVMDAVHDIIQQRRPAPEAARELDGLYVDLVRLEDALRPFVGLAARWDYDAARRPECEHEILVAAEALRRNSGL
jgi:hypothetical protein